jgi:hypothetical protein
MQLARMVTRAYLQKQGDLTGVTMSNVNNLPAARQEIAERYDVCLLNDSNKAPRGEENSMKFKEYVALANVLVAHGQPAYFASILHIAKFYLHPFETSWASLNKSAVLEKADTKATRKVNHIQTSPKASSPSTVKEAGLIAQVAALQTQVHYMQKAMPKAPVGTPAYNRAPPPTSYTASSPYPPIRDVASADSMMP